MLEVMLSIDEEVHGHTETVANLEVLKNKLNELLDERTVEVKIKKRAHQRSSSQSTNNTN